MFVAFVTILVFVFIRNVSKMATERFYNEVAALFALLFFWWFYTNFATIFLATLGLTGITLLIFYFAGIPILAFLVIIIELIGGKNK